MEPSGQESFSHFNYARLPCVLQCSKYFQNLWSTYLNFTSDGNNTAPEPLETTIDISTLIPIEDYKDSVKQEDSLQLDYEHAPTPEPSQVNISSVNSNKYS